MALENVKIFNLFLYTLTIIHQHNQAKGEMSCVGKVAAEVLILRIDAGYAFQKRLPRVVVLRQLSWFLLLCISV